MCYDDWKIKDTKRCDLCKLHIPNARFQKHVDKGNPKVCEFSMKSTEDITSTKQIAKQFRKLPGMDAGSFTSFPIVVSYGALRAGQPDLGTVSKIAAALSKGECYGPFTAANLPQTLKFIFEQGDAWEGFRGEMEEFARLLEKNRVVRLGAIGSDHLDLLNQAKDQFEPEVFTAMVKQVEGLDGDDLLGGDIIDFTKRRVIQLKYLTGKTKQGVEQKIIEAAIQLVGDLKDRKNEVPISVFEKSKDGFQMDTFTTEVAIVIRNSENPYASADSKELLQMVDRLMNITVQDEINKKNKPTDPVKKPYADVLLQGFVKSTFSYFVNFVRIETPTKKFRFMNGKEDSNGHSAWTLKLERDLLKK